MTRSQKPGSNAASARDRVPAGFFHATRFEAAARRDAMCRENARSSMEKSTRGRHGLPRRSRQSGVRMQAQARGRPQPGTALSTSAQEGRRDREVVRRKSKFSAHPPCCSVHGAQQRGKPGIAHNALFRARKEETARRRPASGLRNTWWQGQTLDSAAAPPRIRGAATTLSATRRKTRLPRTSPPTIRGWGCAMWGGPASGFRAFYQEDVSALPRKVRGIPKLRGSRDAPRTMPETSDATKPTPGWKQPSPQGTEKSPGTNETRRETADAATDNTVGNSHCRSPGRASVHVPQDSPARFCSNKHDTPRPSAPRNGTRPVPGTKKGVPQNRNSAERLTVTAQGLPGASIAPSPTG